MGVLADWDAEEQAIQATIDALRAENTRLREALETAVELFSEDAEVNTPGTDAHAWLYHAKEALESNP